MNRLSKIALMGAFLLALISIGGGVSMYLHGQSTLLASYQWRNEVTDQVEQMQKVAMDMKNLCGQYLLDTSDPEETGIYGDI